MNKNQVMDRMNMDYAPSVCHPPFPPGVTCVVALILCICSHPNFITGVGRMGEAGG